ncbi:MAG: GAF domain-containing protein [Anaerolineaceae bacterium]|nr:GAF domain-containing protein [Anaerolineaceae bacterium]
MEKIENKGKSFINKLFSNKNKSPNKPQVGNLPSWEFIVDHAGNYLNISTEVYDCLGIPNSKFIDQSIFSFAINTSSGEKLFELFSKQDFPFEVDVIFVSVDNDLIYCTLKITNFSEEYHSKPTYIGIVQTVESLPKSKVHFSEEKPLESIVPENIAYVDNSMTNEIEDYIEKIGNNGANKKKEPSTAAVIRELDPNKISEFIERFTLEVNHLIEPIDIYKSTFKVINDIVPNNNLILGIMEKGSSKLSIPIRKYQNEISYFPENDPLEPILNYIIASNQVVSSIEQINVQIKKKNISFDNGYLRSILGVPISIGNQTLGAIFLFDNNGDYRFSDQDVKNLETISTKMATALVNANLFQEMHHALTAIETREQHQSFVTHAIKVLTKFGSNRLEEVLELLGKAANVNRVYFAQIDSEKDGKKWNIVSEWASEERYNGFHLTKEIRFDVFEEFFPELLEIGYFQINYENLDSRVNDWLHKRGVFSILVFAVQFDFKLPDLIILEDLRQEHFWNQNEIRFLELVSDTLSSVIINEKNILKLQNQIFESDNISKIKNILYKATSPEQILDAILQYVFPEDVTQAALYIYAPLDISQHDHFEVIANSSLKLEDSSKIQTHTFDRSIVKSLFQTGLTNFIDNPQLADLPKKVIQQLTQLNIQSLAILPLKSKGKLFGSIILTSNKSHAFLKKEQQMVDSLLELIASSIENHLLLDKSSTIYKENEYLKNLKSVIKNQNPTTINSFLSNSLRLDTNNQISIFVYEKSNSFTLSNQIALIKNFSNNEIPSLDEYWQSSDFINLLNELINQDIDNFDNLLNLKIEPVVIEKLQSLNIRSGSFLPLKDKEDVIGYLIIISDQPLNINKEKIEFLRFAVDEIAIMLRIHLIKRDLSQLTERISIAAGIVQETSSILEIDLLMKMIVNQILEKFGFLYTSLHICNSDNSLIEKAEVAYIENDHTNQKKFEEFNSSYLIINDVLEKGHAVIFNGPPVLINMSPNTHPTFSKSQIGLPLKIGDSTIGVLNIHSKGKNEFNEKDLHFFQLLTDQIAIEIQNARQYDKTNRLVEEISDVDRIKSQFLANMSHEFRTPLNSIIGFSKVILTGIDGPINETQKQDLSAIYNAGQYLLRLVNDILDITKIEAGNMKLNMVKTNLSSLIISLLPAADKLVKDKVIKFEFLPADNFPELLIDKDRIAQVLLNLLSNAVKFTEYGKITISTSLEIMSDKQKVVMVKIKDTGVGINKKDQEKLFKPFTQANSQESSRSFGSGIGLAISKSLIELHKGKIGLLESSPGLGSTFFFSLPIN